MELKPMPHWIRASPAFIEQLKRMAERKGSSIPPGRQLYMLGIPVKKDESLRGTQWIAVAEDGNELARGGDEHALGATTPGTAGHQE